MVQLKLKIEGKLNNKLTDFCETYKQSKAGVTREALRLYFKEYNKDEIRSGV